MRNPATPSSPFKAADNYVIQMSFYSAEYQRKTFNNEAFLFFVSCMKGSLRLISCWILSGSLDGFWSSHAAFISEEKDCIWKYKSKSTLCCCCQPGKCQTFGCSIRYFLLLMVQINKLLMEPAVNLSLSDNNTYTIHKQLAFVPVSLQCPC